MPADPRPDLTSGPPGSEVDDVRVVFVCWGNICRSPMAERVAEGAAARAGLTGVRFTSAATSTEETGSPIDPRAVQTLAAAGYRTDGHSAHQITATEARAADLVIAMEDLHVDRIRTIAGADVTVALLSAYDPADEADSGVPDPWYGGQAGFADTLALIEAAVPGVLEAARRVTGERAPAPGPGGTSPAGS